MLDLNIQFPDFSNYTWLVYQGEKKRRAGDASEQKKIINKKEEKAQ